MEVVAAVFADFVTAPRGGPSRLMTELAGRPVVEHALRRVMAVEGVGRRCVFVRPRDGAAAERAVAAAGLGGRIEVVAEDEGVRGRAALIEAARKWSVDAWRGGLLGTSWFDEYLDVRAAARVQARYGCDAVLCLDGHQAVHDPALGSAQIRHLEANRGLAQFVFTPAPPGLTGVIVTPAILETLLEVGIPFGLLLSYRPEIAQGDPITHPSCHHAPPAVAQTAARFLPDTDHGRALLAAGLAVLGENAGAEAWCTWAANGAPGRAERLPVEVEVELTTADPLPASVLRPRGERVPRRAMTELGAFARRMRELAACDDRLVVLGGHGDPLLHPRFVEICGAVRAAGVYGLAVATPLVELSQVACDALFDAPVDVVLVHVDAFSAATYAKVHGRDAYGQVLANLERLEQRRREQRAARPIVVPSLTRCAATIDELEAFYDAWVRRIGAAHLVGHNDYCGRLPADDLISTCPPVRGPCRRLGGRLMLLADGTVALCHQDVAGAYALGDWRREGLEAIWGGAKLAGIREAHGRQALEALPICRVCREWFRP